MKRVLATVVLALSGVGGSGVRAAEVHDPAETIEFGSFRVYQYVSNESDDARVGRCSVPPSASLSLRAYADRRWAGTRVRVVPPEALRQSRCALDAFGSGARKGVLNGGRGLTVAAIRWGPEPEVVADLWPGRPVVSVSGWPRHPRSRPAMKTTPSNALTAGPRRLALVCWPQRDGWPRPERPAGTKATEKILTANPCEWWLLPVRERDEALLSGRALRVGEVVRVGGLLPRAWGQTLARESIAVSRAELARYLGPVTGPISPQSEGAPAPGPAEAVEKTPAVHEASDAPLRWAKLEDPACRMTDPRADMTRPRFVAWAKSLGLAVHWPPGAATLHLAELATPRSCHLFGVLIEALEEHLGCVVPITQDACQER